MTISAASTKKCEQYLHTCILSSAKQKLPTPYLLTISSEKMFDLILNLSC